MTKLETLLESFIFDAMHSGIIRDADEQLLPNEYFPDIVLMMLQEEQGYGRLTNGLVGYTLGKGLNVTEMEVMIPRSVSIACLELIRPFADADRPDLMEVVTRCDKVNNKYLTGKDIEESGATNVTQLH